MSITLKVGATTLALHPDLLWSDEGNWHPVEQTAQRTITGALIVSVGARVGGRPITLEPEDETCAWMRLAVVSQLRNWAAVPGLVMELTLRGVTRNVMFRHQDGPGIDAKPLIHFSDVDTSDYYLVTLRLMEI